MTAPALVMLAHNSALPAVKQMGRALASRLHQMRPSLAVHLAFIGQSSPSLPEVAKDLLAEEVGEIAVVPLDLSRAVQPDDPTLAALEVLRQTNPGLRVGVSRPIGPASSLLSVLDERVRASLRATRAVELDGLVLSFPRAGDVRGNAVVSRRARQWSNHHRLPVVVAVADGTGPSVASAISSLRSQGRRHLAVGSFFIAENEGFLAQAEMAKEAGAVAVGAPIGPDDRLLELVTARYSYAAMELLDMPDLGSGAVVDFDLDEGI